MKKSLSKYADVMLVAICIMSVQLMNPSSAYAYIDPGAGSIILQVILGGVGALAIILKIFWERIVSIFSFNKDTSDESQINVED